MPTFDAVIRFPEDSHESALELMEHIYKEFGIKADRLTEVAEVETIEIYTDGGCKKAGELGAWAYMIRGPGLPTTMFGTEAETTNNRMEMQAVIEALKVVPLEAKVILHTDSEYVQKGITSWIKGWKKRKWTTYDGNPVKNKDLWLEMDELVSMFPALTFKHVKGHAGHEHNEFVDGLCTKAMEEASMYGG